MFSKGRGSACRNFLYLGSGRVIGVKGKGTDRGVRRRTRRVLRFSGRLMVPNIASARAFFAKCTIFRLKMSISRVGAGRRNRGTLGTCRRRGRPGGMLFKRK